MQVMLDKNWNMSIPGFVRLNLMSRLDVMFAERPISIVVLSSDLVTTPEPNTNQSFTRRSTFESRNPIVRAK